MNKFVSGALTLVATTLMVTLSFGCGADFEGETGSQAAELSKGQCNAIVARNLSAAQRCARGQCGIDECEAVGGALLEFFANEECRVFYGAGDVNGLPGNASIHPRTGEIKQIGEVICGSVVQCGLCPEAPPGVCDDPCTVDP